MDHLTTTHPTTHTTEHPAHTITTEHTTASTVTTSPHTPTIGDHVLYVLPNGGNKGQDRPAIIVRVWNITGVNLQVFTDGHNDGEYYKTGMIWETSVPYSEEARPGTWHWPTQKA